MRDASFGRGNHTFGWDGRNDAGEIVPEGTYRPRVELDKLGRAIEFPRQIRVDTTPAELEVTRLRPRVVSPDGDGRADTITIRFRASEPVNALLLVGGRQEVKTAQRLLLDLGQTRERERPYPLPSFARSSHAAALRASAPARQADGPLGPSLSLPSLLRTRTCPRCQAVHVHTARAPAHQCNSCGLTLHRGREPVLQHEEKEAAWER